MNDIEKIIEYWKLKQKELVDLIKLYPNEILFREMRNPIEIATQSLEKQKDLKQLINDIKKDLNKSDTYSVSLVLEMLESIAIN